MLWCQGFCTPPFDRKDSRTDAGGCEYLCSTEAVSAAMPDLTHCMQEQECLPHVRDMVTKYGSLCADAALGSKGQELLCKASSPISAEDVAGKTFYVRGGLNYALDCVPCQKLSFTPNNRSSFEKEGRIYDKSSDSDYLGDFDRAGAQVSGAEYSVNQNSLVPKFLDSQKPEVEESPAIPKFTVSQFFLSHKNRIPNKVQVDWMFDGAAHGMIKDGYTQQGYGGWDQYYVIGKTASAWMGFYCTHQAWDTHGFFWLTESPTGELPIPDQMYFQQRLHLLGIAYGDVCQADLTNCSASGKQWKAEKSTGTLLV
eukprot:TRINITY_DN110283_c0_g1_i1.p1 TRINITY_DN110283_c0_g1~~TRINITY_DN110283_c0_g1_i1.p1  ORF type:complete len:352 (+),score=43.73 TRINITY_DN110283_c0_g1_i1:122-1057(+)